MSLSLSFVARIRIWQALLAAVASLALAGASAMPAGAHARHGKHHGHGHHHRRHHGHHRHHHHPVPPPHPGNVLFVAPNGNDAQACTHAAPCKTIGHAVTVASPGATIVALPGTYAEQVTIGERLRLVGKRGATIDATGQQNGVVLNGAAAAGSLVTGFVVEHATQEGILASQTARVTIAGNLVQSNDLGAASPNPSGECAPQGEVPGDCGEGVHLMSVTDAKVLGNQVTQNSGGILLTDELGPTTRNRVLANHVFDNPFDCGITIAGHNPQAVQNGVRRPDVAGIYRNVIAGNASDDNGLKGEGAGILLAGAGPGTGVYDNLVKHNEASGNNLAGITLHSHAPGDDLNGNRFLGNRLRNDNLGGDPDAGVTQTTGILLFSAVSHLQGIVVRGNVVRDVHFGIWTQNVPPIPVNANRFVNVAVPLQQQ
jgi:nitrous oxidase accessory protein NosD